MKRKILILGGYGNAGYRIAELLLLHTDGHIIIAGRSLQKAQRAVEELRQYYAPDRISLRIADASQYAAMIAVLKDVDMLIVAASCLKHIQTVARACIETETNYVDICLSSQDKWSLLDSLRSKIESKKLTFITDGGFHPGLPAALVRHAAHKFENIESAYAAAALKLNWRQIEFSPETAIEMVQKIKNIEPYLYRNRSWQHVSWRESRIFDFGEFGQHACIASRLLEMQHIVKEIPSLQRAGFLISGFDSFTDYVVLPALMMWNKMVPNADLSWGSRLLSWSLKTFARPPFYCALLLEAAGTIQSCSQELRLLLSHHDAYAMTAVPVAICVMEYFENKRSGLYCQAEFFNAEHIVKKLGSMGIKVNESYTPSLHPNEKIPN